MADKNNAYLSVEQFKKRGKMAPAPSLGDTAVHGNDWQSAKGKAGQDALRKALSGQLGQFDKTEASRPGAYDNDDISSYYDVGYTAHKFVGKPNQTLGDPNYVSSMDDFSAGASIYAHFNEILNTPGSKRNALVRAVVKLDWDLAKDARDAGQNVEKTELIVPERSMGRVIHGLRLAARKQFPIPSRQDMSGPAIITKIEDGFYSSGRPKLRDATPREMIKLNADAKRNTKAMTLPKDDKNIDFDMLIKDFVAEVKQPNMREHTIKTADGKSKKFKGKFAVLAAKGKESYAIEAIKKVPSSAIVLPAQNLLTKTVGQNVSAMVLKGYKDRTQAKTANLALIEQADAVVVYGDDNPKSRVTQDAALAAKRGKLAKYYDTHGSLVPKDEAVKFLKDSYVDPKDVERSRIINGMSQKLSSKEGRLAMMTLRSSELVPATGDAKPKNVSKLSDKDIKALAKTDYTFSEVIDLAEGEEGRAHLMYNDKVSAEGVKLLTDQEAAAAVSTSLAKMQEDLRRTNTTLVGSEDLPDWPNKPTLLFVQGDVTKLASLTNTVGIVSDHIPEGEDSDLERKLITSRAAPLVSALGKQDVSRVFIEDTLPFVEQASSNDIVLLSSGHAVYTSEEQKASRKEMDDRGVLTISDQPPKGWSVRDPYTRQFHTAESRSNEHTQSRAARIVGGISQELVIVNMDSNARKSLARDAASEFYKHTDKRPVAVDLSGMDLKFAAGNNALATNRGKNAFNAAGFGEAMFLTVAERFDGANPAIRTGPNPEKAAKNIAKMAAGETPDAVYPASKTKKRQAEIH